MGSPFGDVVGGLASAGNALASKAKSVAKAATSEVATDARLFAGGANQVLGMPTFNTLKGATQGHPADVAKVGAAAALIIPASRGFRAAGVFREASDLPLAERAGLAARSAVMSSPLFHGTTASAAAAIRVEGFSPVAKGSQYIRDFGAAEGSAIPTFVTDSAKTASSYARTAAWFGRLEDLSARPAIVVARAARGSKPLMTETLGRGFGSELSFRPQDVHAVTPFPDTMANVARRVKGRVMGAISMQGESDLASKIAATKEEIVKIGGTVPTGPFAGATEAKLAAVKGEIAGIDKGAADVAQMSLVQRAKSAGMAALKGGEEGWIRAGTQAQLRSPANPQGRMVSTLRFGAGKFPGEEAIGELPKAGYYEAHLTGGKTPGSVKVNWLGRHGSVNFKDVQSEMTAIGRGLKARGITAVEHEPLSASRSRLFAGLLKDTGFTNVDKGAPDIKKNRNQLSRGFASGWD